MVDDVNATGKTGGGCCRGVLDKAAIEGVHTSIWGSEADMGRKDAREPLALEVNHAADDIAGIVFFHLCDCIGRGVNVDDIFCPNDLASQNSPQKEKDREWSRFMTCTPGCLLVLL